MILLELFLTFLKIGAVSFGGGYGMISLMREKALMHGWLSEEELLNMIAVAESTPGPIAVNMATFVGAEQGGSLGALVATLGVVLPSFAVILLIAALLRNLLKYAGVKAFLGGIRPVVIGLILSVALTMILQQVVGFASVTAPILPDWKGMIILLMLLAIGVIFPKRFKKKPSPILMILLSAGLGMLVYGVLPQ
jgi:chromate transporter